MPEAKSTQSYVLTRWLFFRLFGLIHFTAFFSYAFQIIGLNGSHGILPTKDMFLPYADLDVWQRALLFPTLSWFNSSDGFLQGMTICGSVLSVAVILGVATGPCLLILAILWLSICTGGGEFTGFQSDGMLVEATVLSLFFVPWQWFEPPWPVPQKLRQQTKPPLMGLWLLRFMLFRTMFASGMVKILSGDMTWRNLTAMDFHFETQPIPTPLAWYFHHLPEWIHKSSVVGMFVSELLAPLFMFGPRIIRYVGAVLIIGLHFSIAITGNYTFLSYLMMLLGLLMFDDQFFEKFAPPYLVSALNDSIDVSKFGRIRESLYKAAGTIFFIVAGAVFTASIYGREVLIGPLRPLAAIFSSLQLANSYGLFAVMTTTRPEIVFEGSDDGVNWKTYEFPCKPGDNLRQAPPWVAPHMPRLDWRLWFAAMGPIEQNQWVFSLVKRMLEGEPTVTKFFAVNPFPDHPPKFIRAYVYDYHFTDEQEKQKTGDWWRRDNKRLYLPPVSLKDGLLEGAELN